MPCVLKNNCNKTWALWKQELLRPENDRENELTEIKVEIKRVGYSNKGTWVNYNVTVELKVTLG